jgi:hypothetical protein
MLASTDKVAIIPAQGAPRPHAPKPTTAVVYALDGTPLEPADASGSDHVTDAQPASDLTAELKQPGTDPASPMAEQSWIADWAQIWSNAATSMLQASTTLAQQSIDESLRSLAEAGKQAAKRPVATSAAAEVSLWSTPAKSASPRSWYRKPTPNLFDPTAWGFPAPFAAFGVPTSTASILPSMPMMMGWPGLGTSFQHGFGSNFGGSNFGLGYALGTMGGAMGSAMGVPAHPLQAFSNPFARPIENPMTAWLSGVSNTATNLTNVVTNAMAPNPYASYRSDSGYAVAQIAVAPAKTEDPAAAFWKLFTWPTMRT